MKKIIALLLLCAAHPSWGAGVDYDDTDILIALTSGDLPNVRYYLRQINNPDYNLGWPGNLLHNASTVEVARELLDAGANIESQEEGFGNTPFLSAVKRGTLPVVKFLKEQGANINARNARGESAREVAKGALAFVTRAKGSGRNPVLQEMVNETQETLEYIEQILKEQPAVAAPPAARPVPRPPHMGAGAGAGAGAQPSREATAGMAQPARTLEIETNFVALPQYKSFQAWKKKYAAIDPADAEAMIAYDTLNAQTAQQLLNEIEAARLIPEQLETVLAEFDQFLKTMKVHEIPALREQKETIKVTATSGAPTGRIRQAPRPQEGAGVVTRRVTATRREPAMQTAHIVAGPRAAAGAGAGEAQSDVTLWQQINDLLLANKAKKYDAWAQNAKDAIDNVGSQIPENSPLRAFLTPYYTRYDQLLPQEREKMINAFKLNGALLFGEGKPTGAQKYKIRQLISTWFPEVSARQEVEKILASKLQ